MSTANPPMSVHRASLATAVSWLALAAIGLSLLWWLFRYWTGQPESADRVLILIGAAWLAFRSRNAIRQLPCRPAIVGVVLIAPAAVLVPVAWYLYALVGPMPILLWWLALVGVAATAGFLIVQLGFASVRPLTFPLLFLLFALPLPTSALDLLQGRLQSITSSSAARMLMMVGVNVQQKGNILSLPSGDLGVVEACSGVRGVTAIVAVAALVAYLRGFGPVRGVLLTLLALPVIAVSNIVRVFLSAVLQEWLGPWVNQSWPHELLGVVTLLVGLAGVLAVSWVIGKMRRLEKSLPQPLPEAGRGARESFSPPRFGEGLGEGFRTRLAATFLTIAVLGSVAAVWYAGRVTPGIEPEAPIAEIPLRIGTWAGVDEPTDDGVRTALACDTIVHRAYRDPAGQSVHCWVIYWSAASAIKDYVHHPDVCWPKQGWTPVGQDRKAVTLPAGTPLEMTVRRFERDGRRQMIAYWAQDGNHVWSAEEEESAHSSWPTQRWVLDRLLNRQSLERTPRVVVLVGADVWDASGYAERAVEGFAKDLAEELYRVCPWAKPGS
jgi:EpsI family protein